jgi:hypothetical protein
MPQLTTFNLNHFKMVEDVGLKLLHRGSLEWHCLPTKYHENLPSGSKVSSGTHTHTQTGHLISLLSFLESRLKTQHVSIKKISGQCRLGK